MKAPIHFQILDGEILLTQGQVRIVMTPECLSGIAQTISEEDPNFMDCSIESPWISETMSPDHADQTLELDELQSVLTLDGAEGKSARDVVTSLPNYSLTCEIHCWPKPPQSPEESWRVVLFDPENQKLEVIEATFDEILQAAKAFAEPLILP